jgi:hypothetical protein
MRETPAAGSSGLSIANRMQRASLHCLARLWKERICAKIKSGETSAAAAAGAGIDEDVIAEDRFSG